MLYNQIQEAVAFIKGKTDFQPKYGIILGTGLGNLTDEIDVVIEIPIQRNTTLSRYQPSKVIRAN